MQTEGLSPGAMAFGAAATALSAHSLKRRRFSDQNGNMSPEVDPSALGAVACAKRYRHADENRDVPVYSQRQLEFLEQRKDAETHKLRHEFEEHVAKKDAEQLRASQEHGKLLELFAALRAEFDKASSENAVLKRAVSIQHKKQTSADAQLHAFVEAGTRAAAYVKQLEQTNYALRAHLSQMSGSAPGNAFDGRPPDVC